MENNKFVLTNNLDEILKRKNISIRKLSNKTNISRQTIKRISENRYLKTSTYTSMIISHSLNMSIDDIFRLKLNPKFLFTEDNLKKFDSFNKHLNMNFFYDIYGYSNNMCPSAFAGQSLNIHSDYFGQRRISFSGNFLILSRENLLFIRDFDLLKKDQTVSLEEMALSYEKILNAIISFAKYVLKLNKVKIRLGVYNVNLNNINSNTSPEKFNRLIVDYHQNERTYQYLSLSYTAAFKCGFRFSSSFLSHRCDFDDICLQKNIN